MSRTTTPARNNREVLGDGLCSVCEKPLGAIFQRLRVDLGAIDVKSVQRHHGLAMFFGGGAAGHALSSVMGDVDLERMVAFSSDIDPAGEETICIHIDCLINAPIDFALIRERAAAARKTETD